MNYQLEILTIMDLDVEDMKMGLTFDKLKLLDSLLQETLEKDIIKSKVLG